MKSTNNKINIKDRYSTKKHQEYKIKDSHLATPFNRFLSFIVDIFIAILIANAFNSTLLHQIMGYNTALKEAHTYRTQLVAYNTNTKLYSYDKDENALKDEEYFSNYLKALVLESNNPQNPIYFYYINYTDVNSVESINKQILSLSQDSLSNDFYVASSLNAEAKIKDEVNLACSDYLMGYATNEEKNTYKSFETYYMGLIKNARDNLAERNEVKSLQKFYEDAVIKTTKATSRSGLVGYLLGTLFAFWIVPMVFQKKTFGQMIFRIQVVFIDNEKVTHFDMLSRYIMMIPLIFWGAGFTSFADYFASSILLPFIGGLTYFIPCLVSLLLCLVEMVVLIKSNKHQGYYDRSLNMTVVSYNPKQIGYDDKGE